MIVKKEIILPHVYVLTFDTQYDLCMSFVRMQEFYESPKFKNKYFTLEDFMDYWSEEFGNGLFDYPTKWSGFNLSSKIIEKWKSKVGYPHEIRDREWHIINAIDELLLDEEEKDGYMPNKYYVIGVYCKGNTKEKRLEVINHESAHAFYDLNSSYKKLANKLLKEMDKQAYLDAEYALIKMGYGKNVIKDEMQAYFSTNVISANSKIVSLGNRAEFVQNFNQFKENHNGS
jgi:hypothetical protein